MPKPILLLILLLSNDLTHTTPLLDRDKIIFLEIVWILVFLVGKPDLHVRICLPTPIVDLRKIKSKS